MDFILAFVGGAVPCLCESLRHQCNYLLHYGRNTSTLKDKVKELEAKREDVRVLVESARSELKDIKSEVRRWLEKADDLLKEEEANKGCCLNCCRRYKLSREAPKMASQIDEHLGKEKDFGSDVSLPVPRKPKFRTASEETFQKFSSMDKALQKVRNDLKDVSVVGVHGMGGVGKTTMVEHLGATALKDKLFDHVVKVTVSQTVDLIDIQNQLARGLGLTFGNGETEDDRKDKLTRKLIQEKNVLIILDDLWTPIELFKVGIDVGVLKDSNSKILLTTRKKDVCNLMDSRETNLDQLSKADSWSFFENIVGPISDDSAEFKSIRRKVAEECGGLPLVLQTIAKTLRTRGDQDWRIALARLKKSQPANNDDDEEMNLFRRLKLSYDYLKVRQAKYFLLCCLFPEDHNISTEELARYGLGLNLFENRITTMEDARDESHMIACELLKSGLLSKGDKEDQVKMHDVMRDMAIRITSPSKEAQTASSSSDVNEVFLVNADRILKVDANCTGISLMSNARSLPDVLECPKLQILLLQDNKYILGAIPDTFFERTNALKVLNLNGLQATSLPSSIGSLGNIRILHLDHSKLKDVSILGILKNLEVLSLKESHIEALSEDLGQLINLRLLDLTMCANIKTIPSKLLSRLKSLEELYMQGSFADWELVDGANTTIEGRKASFGELINLPFLTVLKVDISDVKCIPSSEFQPLPSCEKFSICLCKSKFARSKTEMFSGSNTKFSTNLVLDLSMKKLPSRFLRRLSQVGVNNLIYTHNGEVLNILEEHEWGRLNNLMSLSVGDMDHEAPLMSMNSPEEKPVFEGLEKLRFHNICLMKQMCAGELPKGSLAKLSSLDVKQCNDLVSSLLSSNLIKRLDSLEVLNVNGNIGVTEVFGFEGLQEGQSYLKNLKELRLNNLANLVNIWKGSAGFATFTNLKLVTVIKCEKMTHLFSVSMSQSLQQLEDIWVEDCSAMKEIIESDQANSSIVNVKLPKLKTLSLQNLPQLTSFYVHNANLECPSLEDLHVENCPFFTAATADFHSANQVQKNNEQHMKLLRKRMKE